MLVLLIVRISVSVLHDEDEFEDHSWESSEWFGFSSPTAIALSIPIIALSKEISEQASGHSIHKIRIGQCCFLFCPYYLLNF
jgi:hypothetical protein